MQWDIYHDIMTIQLHSSLERFERCVYRPIDHCEVSDYTYVLKRLDYDRRFTGCIITNQGSVIDIKAGIAGKIFIKTLISKALHLHLNNDLLTLVKEEERNAFGYFCRFKDSVIN